MAGRVFGERLQCPAVIGAELVADRVNPALELRRVGEVDAVEKHAPFAVHPRRPRAIALLKRARELHHVAPDLFRIQRDVVPGGDQHVSAEVVAEDVDGIGQEMPGAVGDRPVRAGEGEPSEHAKRKHRTPDGHHTMEQRLADRSSLTSYGRLRDPHKNGSRTTRPLRYCF